MAFDSALNQALSGNRLELSLQDRSGKVANFHAIYDDIVAGIKEAMLDCAEETRDLAYAFCPVQYGFMREHIRVVTSQNNQVFEIGWRAEDFYAAGFDFYPMFVVLGTRHMAPRDPLTPAHEITKPRYAERSAQLVQMALERRKVS
jgi:tricorn protease-like protein